LPFDIGRLTTSHCVSVMDSKERKSIRVLVAVGILFLVIGIWGTIRLSRQPGIDATFEQADGGLRVREVAGNGKAQGAGLASGDVLLEIDQHPIRDRVDLNFELQQRKVGQAVGLTLQKDGETVYTSLPLTRHYDWFFLVVNFLAGLLTWIMGVWVFVKKPQGQVVRLYLFCSLTLSLALLVPRAGYPFGPQQISFVLPSFQMMAYTLLPALFFHFCVIFPREEEASLKRKPVIYSGYIPAVALIGLLELFYWRSISSESLVLFHTYSSLFLVFRIYLVAYVLLGLFALYQTYKKLEFLEEKRKIRWIFWGIVVGTFPFLFLHTLPDILLGRSLIPEVVKSLFVLLIPLSFAFSILRYRTMNVDVVINRSLVYSLLTGFILGIYLLVAGLLGDVLHKLTGYQGSLFPILATLVAAVLFTPAKNRIRTLVDKTFYRVRYDYRRAIQQFTRQMDLAFTQDGLCDLLLKRIDLLLAITTSVAFLKEEQAGELRMAASVGLSPEELNLLEPQKKELAPALWEEGEARGAAGSTAFQEFPLLPQNPVLERFRIQLSFPMTSKEEPVGLLLLGAKKSGARYSAEDVELVSLMVQEVARAVQNMRMKQRMLSEQLGRKKLEELNQLKTKFISNVSHDLRTPLTAIRFSADNMLKGVYGGVSEENRRNLEMIRDNTLHVSRTIDNLLTLCMSESGKLALNKERLFLSAVVEEACGMLKSFAGKKNTRLVKENMEGIYVRADKHSLLEILLNLLDNAIKYTSKGGVVSVSAGLVEGDDLVEISVTDDGVGIAPEHLERIFERFQRAEPVGITGEKGTGIGLDIVRNLVHLHGGDVKVESPVPGKKIGARFTFTLERG
jgi:signal transduction histidine kinase